MDFSRPLPACPPTNWRGRSTIRVVRAGAIDATGIRCNEALVSEVLQFLSIGSTVSLVLPASVALCSLRLIDGAGRDARAEFICPSARPMLGRNGGVDLWGDLFDVQGLGLAGRGARALRRRSGVVVWVWVGGDPARCIKLKQVESTPSSRGCQAGTTHSGSSGCFA